jgi:2-keto-4-pentenoate hydratase/2-oxohepta-3-ene-1,7-dioic acid hydratase in catechol pathway
MKLLRFGPAGQERPGLLDDDGNIRDLGSLVPDIDATTITPESLRALRKASVGDLPIVPGPIRLGVPVARIGKIVGVGLNYSDHAEECGALIPTTPILFLKPSTALCGPHDPVILPPGSTCTDWEVELGVFIGREARHVSVEEALQHVAGYCVANDVSERHDQLQLGPQWTKGKSHDTFCPVGPWLVTPDEVGDVQDLAMWCDVNDRRVQDSSTRRMIFNVAQCVSDISRYMTLLPGDLIITGTPAGVGLGRKPPLYLRAGDVMTLGIDKLGTQRQLVTEAIATPRVTAIA